MGCFFGSSKEVRRLKQKHMVQPQDQVHDYSARKNDNTLSLTPHSQVRHNKVEHFASTYRIDYPAALYRLVTSSVPATVEHRTSDAVAASSTICLVTVAECLQNFITTMYSLKLNMLGVDQIHPLLSHILASLSTFPFDLEGKTEMKKWKSRLSKMSPADELTEQQAQRLHFDLKSSYDEFMKALQQEHYLPSPADELTAY